MHSPSVIQYCPSLGKACGIATYTEMLSDDQHMIRYRSLADIPSPPTHLHMQHEFGIVSMKELRRVRDYCRKNSVQWYITMHTVVPLPTFRRYVRYRLRRLYGRMRFFLLRNNTSLPAAIRFLAMRSVGVTVRKIDSLLWHRTYKLWERLHSWKNRSLPHVSLSSPLPTIQTIGYSTTQEWVWTEENPEYDIRSFFFYRATQRFIIEHADTIIVHSAEAQKALQKMGATSTEVVAHGLRAFRTSKHLLSEKDGKLHVGCFGFFKIHKSLHEIIEACRRLDNVVLHIYASIAHTDRHSAYLKMVHEQAAHYPWIELETAHLPLDASVYRLSQCDVNVWYCLPPGAISTSGSIRQYLAAKRPIIASSNIMISDIRHLLHVVPAHAPDLLSKAIANYSPDTHDLEEYVENHVWQKTRATYTLASAV